MPEGSTENAATVVEPAHIPFVTNASYPTRHGNRVELLIDGLTAFRRICEAIETARSSVWATVTFMWPRFEMPEGRGSAFDVLERAAQRGLDVRLLFWRPDTETASLKANAFWGAPEHIELLRTRGPNLHVRWDCAEPGFCQHQKTWLIDAGTDGEIAYIGGINLNPHSMCAAPHDGTGQNHDTYVELLGPSTVDVHHNFVQRWDGLPFPARVPAIRGPATVQIQRTAPDEHTIFEQFVMAARAARHAIYIEQQYIEVAAIVASLEAALARGIEVIVVVPATPDRRTFTEGGRALGRFTNFTLAGLAGRAPDGRRTPVYVHSKLMLVDDVWASVGSCNFHRFSLFGNSEMNAAIACPESVAAFRTALFREHIGIDTSHFDCRTASQMFRAVALNNRRRLSDGDHDWQGIAFALDVEGYGR